MKTVEIQQNAEITLMISYKLGISAPASLADLAKRSKTLLYNMNLLLLWTVFDR